MSEQKVRVHSENDKDFERGSKIMISTYLRMFWINNRAEDRKTLWVLQSLLQPTGVTVEQRNTKINLRHVRNLRLHIIHSYHSSMMSAWHCAACWPNKHINADTKKHITWKILSLISVQPFLWMGSVCVWSRWHAHGTHTHTNTKAWVIHSLPPCSQLAQFQSNRQNLYWDRRAHSESAGFTHYI